VLRSEESSRLLFKCPEFSINSGGKRGGRNVLFILGGRGTISGRSKDGGAGPMIEGGSVFNSFSSSTVMKVAVTPDANTPGSSQSDVAGKEIPERQGGDVKTSLP